MAIAAALVAVAAIASPPAAAADAAATTAGPADVTIRRAYVDGPYGQIHVRIAEPRRRAAIAAPPLACFHYSPGSGRMYESLQPWLAVDRRVFVFDTPGYGASDAPPSQPTLPDYARALTVALEALGEGPGQGRPIDLLGHLTGSLIATELATTQPRWVRRVVLSQAPAFDAERRRSYVADLEQRAADRRADPRGAYLIERLKRGLEGLEPGEPPEAYMGAFIDSVTPGHKWLYGDVAAISYPAEDIFPRVTQPVLLLTYPEMTASEWTRTPKLLPRVRVVALEGRGLRSWQRTPDRVAATIRGFLDELAPVSATTPPSER